MNERKSSREDALDAGLRDSFPASDPVAVSQPTTATPSQDGHRDAGAGDKARETLTAAHSRVNVSTEQDIRYWMERFDVAEDKLKEAVRKAGFLPQDVADYLGKPL
jgi:hypothetical protein